MNLFYHLLSVSFWWRLFSWLHCVLPWPSAGVCNLQATDLLPPVSLTALVKLKRTKNGMCWNHQKIIPPPPPLPLTLVHGKTVFLKIGPWCQNGWTAGQVQRKRYLGSLAVRYHFYWIRAPTLWPHLTLSKVLLKDPISKFSHMSIRTVTFEFRGLYN